jgi:hypothetical protein
MKFKRDSFSAVLILGVASLLAISLTACTAERKPPRSSATLEKAKKVQLSSVYYDGLPLGVVINMLHDESARRDPAHQGIAFSLGPDAQQFADLEVKLELKNVTLAETLERIADSVGLEVQANDTELLLVRKKAKQ